MTCEYCTGSHDLADQPELGPCVCCTPAAMRALEAEAEAEAAGEEGRIEEAEARIMAVLGEASAALSDYLVSLGMSAHPVAQLADPYLDRLVDLLGE